MQTPRILVESSDARIQQLSQWVSEVLGSTEFALTTASADASFRRYFRIAQQQRSWIAMDAPPDKEDVRPFIEVAEILAGAGVNAPRVLHRNLAQGYLLLTDLGVRTYLMDLERGLNVEQLYGDALTALVHMQAGARHAAPSLPPYDVALLRREMELFPEWFLQRHLGIAADDDERRMLEDVFEGLIDVALAQPRVFVHRDYHSRNLMVCGDERVGPNPGVLDFQDAVYGPVTYDLVSLLRDCYIAWPPEQVQGWVRAFRQQASAAGIEVGRDEQEFMRWFDLMGLQRHLKVLGIFARLWHRDGKRGYLKEFPRILDYVLPVTASYPELQSLREFFERRVQPALARVA